MLFVILHLANTIDLNISFSNYNDLLNVSPWAGLDLAWPALVGRG
jgi:hypothetical protein